MGICNRDIVYTSKPHNMKVSKQKFTEGVNICVWILFTCLIIHIGIENFAKYGIIRGPFQLTLDFIEYIQTNWWIYFVVFISFWLQLLLCYIIENLLIWKSVSEQIGMGLHIFNSLLVLNVITALIYVYQCSPFTGATIMGIAFTQPFKCWSYIYINRKHRLGLHNHKKDDDQGTKTIIYPQNVKLQNLAEFATNSQILTYTLNGVKKKPRDLTKAFKLICYAIVAHYMCAFLLYQFILPEMEVASEHLLRRNILSFVMIAFKLAIPVCILWITYFYFYYFECYLSLFSCACGTEDAHLMSDWWNAETTAIYWSKWNIQVHTVLKDCIFVPLVKMGYSKFQASLAVFLVSGFLHEYLVTVPCRTGYGLATFGMLMQIPLACISTYAYTNFSAKLGNLVFWLSLIIGHDCCFIILYFMYNYNNSLIFP